MLVISKEDEKRCWDTSKGKGKRRTEYCVYYGTVGGALESYFVKKIMLFY